MGLEHYNEVRDGLRLPRFQQVRAIPAPTGEDPWDRHARGMSDWRLAAAAATLPTSLPERSLLDLKTELAYGMLQSCDLCPHLCGVDRTRDELGYCGVGSQSAIHWEGILYNDELEVAPSHEVYFSGCSMRCAFCQSHDFITHPRAGEILAPRDFARRAARRREEGAVCLNLVGGEPIVHLPFILSSLRLQQDPVPVVWNSNMFATPRTMDLLDGIVDLYLGDIHFGNDACAMRLGRIPDYVSPVQMAFRRAVESGAGVIIRHLMMPGHLDCCAIPAMEWAAAELPSTPFHLMFQYIPDFRAIGDPVLGRMLTAREIDRARKAAGEIGVHLYRADLDPKESHAAEGIGQNRREREDMGLGIGRSACSGSGRSRCRAPGGTVGEAEGESGDGESDSLLGGDVEIIIHDDGRVTFVRLVEELLPVAAEVGGETPAIRSRVRRAPGPRRPASAQPSEQGG